MATPSAPAPSYAAPTPTTTQIVGAYVLSSEARLALEAIAEVSDPRRPDDHRPRADPLLRDPAHRRPARRRHRAEPRPPGPKRPPRPPRALRQPRADRLAGGDQDRGPPAREPRIPGRLLISSGSCPPSCRRRSTASSRAASRRPSRSGGCHCGGAPRKTTGRPPTPSPRSSTKRPFWMSSTVASIHLHLSPDGTVSSPLAHTT